MSLSPATEDSNSARSSLHKAHPLFRSTCLHTVEARPLATRDQQDADVPSKLRFFRSQVGTLRVFNHHLHCDELLSNDRADAVQEQSYHKAPCGPISLQAREGFGTARTTVAMNQHLVMAPAPTTGEVCIVTKLYINCHGTW